METFPMTRSELEAVGIFERLIRRELKQKEAAKLLGLKSVRQVKRKLKDFRRDGPRSLIHGLRGKPANHQLPSSLKEEAIRLVETEYRDFAPTFAAEKLLENHQLKIGKESLRLLMIEAEIWKPKFKKQGEVHEWRPRRECRGDLVQLDGSDHDWFEGRLAHCCLISFIDDATSEPLWLEFVPSESTEGVMLSLWHYLEAVGRPLALYTDRGGVYKVNLGNPEGELLTQYARALKELEIEAIYARSPQAKGRVERLFGTLQDRLVKEMRLLNISSLDEANCYLREVYLKKHTAKFAVPAKSSADLHRSLEGFDLAHILSKSTKRCLTSDWCLRYRNRWLQLLQKQPRILSKKEQIEIREHLNGSLHLWLRKAELHFKELPERPVPNIAPTVIRHVMPVARPTTKAGSRAFLFAH